MPMLAYLVWLFFGFAFFSRLVIVLLSTPITPQRPVLLVLNAPEPPQFPKLSSIVSYSREADTIEQSLAGPVASLVLAYTAIRTAWVVQWRVRIILRGNLFRISAMYKSKGLHAF